MSSHLSDAVEPGASDPQASIELTRRRLIMSSVPKSNEVEDGLTGVTNPGSDSGSSPSSKGRTVIAGAMVTACGDTLLFPALLESLPWA